MRLAAFVLLLCAAPNVFAARISNEEHVPMTAARALLGRGNRQLDVCEATGATSMALSVKDVSAVCARCACAGAMVAVASAPRPLLMC